jgi:hypothetical protein
MVSDDLFLDAAPHLEREQADAHYGDQRSP